MSTVLRAHHEVIIAGAGFSGIAMGIALSEDGHSDYVILEQADDLGGTWRDNTYPGCQCDVPSIVYSLTGDQNPRWSELFATQPEIWDYMRDVVERHGVAPHIRYGHEVLGAAWSEEGQVWEIDTAAGAFSADVFISGIGALCEPHVPELEGLDAFAGHTFHSARWDHGHELRGRRVAVIGSGASAIQFVPRIVDEVAELHLFQRTPPWIFPRPEMNIPPFVQDRFERHPWLLHAARWTIFSAMETRHRAFSRPGRRLSAANERRARRHLDSQVADPELRRRLTPDFRVGCKRVLLSNAWYPAIIADNATLASGGARRVVAEGVIDEAGALHEVDTIILGTGFRVTDNPVWSRLHGRDGVSLTEAFGGSPKAYYGTAVAGFPNYFCLLGPGTALGHNSVLLMIEAQIGYIRQALAFRDRRGLAGVEPRARSQAEYIEEIDAKMQGSVWVAGGCASWYQDVTGRVSVLWPQSVRAFQRRVAHFVPGEHRFTLPHAEPPSVPAAGEPEAVPA